jgi:hypothetical protein
MKNQKKPVMRAEDFINPSLREMGRRFGGHLADVHFSEFEPVAFF